MTDTTMEPTPQETIPNVVPSTPLTYEETPVITPEPEPSAVEQPTTESATPAPIPQQPRSHGAFDRLKIVFLLIVLFVIGFALSGVVRNAIDNLNSPKQTSAPTPTPTKDISVTEEKNTPTPTITSATVSATPRITQIITPSITPSITGWTVYNVLNGKTRMPIDGLAVQLPNTVLAPVCDGTSCGSQGTYLPGGTRFTIAARGAGQVLADFRGKTITDANGKALMTTPTTVGGKQATEYKTETNGSTNGGYGFTAMHGYMIILSDTMSLEINHFSPAGITTDFTADDVMFASIIKTITFPTNLTTSASTAVTTLVPTNTVTIAPTSATVAPIR